MSLIFSCHSLHNLRLAFVGCAVTEQSIELVLSGPRVLVTVPRHSSLQVPTPPLEVVILTEEEHSFTGCTWQYRPLSPGQVACRTPSWTLVTGSRAPFPATKVTLYFTTVKFDIGIFKVDDSERLLGRTLGVGTCCLSGASTDVSRFRSRSERLPRVSTTRA